MKKIILIIVIVVGIALGVAIWYFSGTQAPAPGQQIPPDTLPPVATSTPGANFPTGDTFQIATPQGGVVVKNFYKNPVEITSDEKSVLVARVDAYDISYYRPDSSFAISLMQKPLEAARTQAEEAFLADLGISQADACKLSVTVGAPVSVDPEHAGINMGLSFCSPKLQ